LAYTVLAIIAIGWFWLEHEDPLRLTAAIWTAATAWGVFSTLWTLYDVTIEYYEARASHRRDLAMINIAQGNVRREALRAMALISLLLLGILVLFTSTSGVFTRMILIVVALALVSNSVLDRMERRRTAEILRHRAYVADA